VKAKHFLALGLMAVGALFLFHMYRSHGGVSGIKQGLGFSGGGGMLCRQQHRMSLPR
jgi:hypothetical protein